jgi:hypothetical protein
LEPLWNQYSDVFARNPGSGAGPGSDNVGPVIALHRLLVLPAAAGCLLLGAGCGGDTIDAAKLEAAVQAETFVKTDTKIESVDCPSGVQVSPGTRFVCTVTAADGAEAVAELEILNDDADVDFLSLTKP